jgi:hypothetical protein
MLDINDLKNIVQNNLTVGAAEAESIIFPILKKIPVPTTNVKKGTFIERAVIVDRSMAPFPLSRLSYIPNSIKDKATPGRFNRQMESTFYGAFTEVKSPEITRFFLACEIIQDLLLRDNHTFKFTVSKWLTTDSFPSILFAFDEKYCTNDLLKISLQEFRADTNYINLSENEKEVLKLITTELAKPSPINGYTISNVIFDFYKKHKFGSIIYPGVQSVYKGNNIALLPSFVDKYFSFFMGAEFELKKVGKKIEINDIWNLRMTNNGLEYFVFPEEVKSEVRTYPT